MKIKLSKDDYRRYFKKFQKLYCQDQTYLNNEQIDYLYNSKGSKKNAGGGNRRVIKPYIKFFSENCISYEEDGFMIFEQL